MGHAGSCRWRRSVAEIEGVTLAALPRVGAVSGDWYTGNAGIDGAAHRGWVLGHFMRPGGGIRATTDLEVKWGIHPAGDRRDGWTTDERRTTVVMLVSGRFRLDLSVGPARLERSGDYAVWGPGVNHSWQAEDDSVVITIRWPSIAT